VTDPSTAVEGRIAAELADLNEQRGRLEGQLAQLEERYDEAMATDDEGIELNRRGDALRAAYRKLDQLDQKVEHLRSDEERERRINNETRFRALRDRKDTSPMSTATAPRKTTVFRPATKKPASPTAKQPDEGKTPTKALVAKARSEWGIEAWYDGAFDVVKGGRGNVGHVVPEGHDETLCGLKPSSWKNSEAGGEPTCLWCLARLQEPADVEPDPKPKRSRKKAAVA
jgi:hypothetical protein